MNRLRIGHFDGHRSTAPPCAAQDSVKKKDHGADLTADTQSCMTVAADTWAR